jgi:hypothetical protein
LVLDVEAVLVAQVEQGFALHAQLVGQLVDADLLFLLQAVTPLWNFEATLRHASAPTLLF